MHSMDRHISGFAASATKETICLRRRCCRSFNQRDSNSSGKCEFPFSTRGVSSPAVPVYRIEINSSTKFAMQMTQTNSHILSTIITICVTGMSRRRECVCVHRKLLFAIQIRNIVLSFYHLSHANKKIISLFSLVSDPPEISVETPIVYSGEGQEAMLVCIVHGEAQPDVSYFFFSPLVHKWK